MPSSPSSSAAIAGPSSAARRRRSSRSLTPPTTDDNDDLCLSSDDEILTTQPVYLSQAHGPNLHLFQYPVTDRVELPDSARELGLKLGARWKAGVRRFELEIPLDTRPEIYDRDRGAEFGAGAALQADKEAAVLAASRAGAAVGGSRKGVKKEREREGQAAAGAAGGEDKEKLLRSSRLRSEIVPGQTVYMAGSIKEGALYLHPLALQLQLRPSLDYLTALDERARDERRRERAAEHGEDDEEDQGQGSAGAKDEVGKAVAVTVKRAPTDGGPVRVANSNIQVLRTEAEEQWVKMAWHDVDSDQAATLRQAIYASPPEAVLESATRGVDLLESKPVGPSARWA